MRLQKRLLSACKKGCCACAYKKDAERAPVKKAAERP